MGGAHGNARAAPPAIRTSFFEPYKLVYSILPQAGVREPNLKNGPSFKAQGTLRVRDTEVSMTPAVCFYFSIVRSRSLSPACFTPPQEGKGVGWGGVRVAFEHERRCRGRGRAKHLGPLWVRPSPPLHWTHAAIFRPSSSGLARPVKIRHRSTASCRARATIAFFRAARFT